MTTPGGNSGRGALRTDAGLLQRFRDGDKAALEEVYRAYVDVVARAVAGTLRRCVGGDRARVWRQVAVDLPDLVQEVFVRAFAPVTRRRFDGIREYGPYVAQIARNVVVDHLRARRLKVTHEPIILLENFSMLTNPHQGAEDIADLQTMALVGDYVASLPADLRQIHEALYVRGLSQREAAAALGMIAFFGLESYDPS